MLLRDYAHPRLRSPLTLQALLARPARRNVLRPGTVVHYLAKPFVRFGACVQGCISGDIPALWEDHERFGSVCGHVIE